MKTQPANRETGTFEDLIFEGRNKSYGAFDLNRKRNRFLLTAFAISFAGITTCIAVPFINAFKGDGYAHIDNDGYTSIDLTPIKQKSDVPLPPPPEKLEDFEKSMISNLAPKVVEEAEDFDFIINEDLFDKSINLPPDIEPFPVAPDNAVIPVDEYEKPVDFPTEQASFMGGDVNDFRKWVSERITYPPDAAESNIFGKVIIEFCVNRKGEVVEIKVLRGLHPSVDDATMKVISSSPKWIPAKQGGNPVKTRYIIPFMFDLI
ncbi:MAG TPA: energy transducer TonB [Bacteroidales bacterium]|nr:energy transducer TonB [Bacteroidales bacterium]